MTQTAKQREPKEGWPSLWLGVLTGPIVYSLHFVAVYLLVETACKARLLEYTLFGLNGISFWVLVVTVVAALISAYSTFTSYREWRRTQRNGEQDAERNEAYQQLMASVGLGFSGFFTIVILLTGLPALFLVVCDWV